MDATDYDTVVIGAGIVGLAAARELLLRYPGLRLAVVDKDRRAGRQQTGHNSGVVHTGIYYKPGSLKARLCVEGRRDLLAFCGERGIRVDYCGKLVVATRRSELPRLRDIHERGLANGVQGLKMLGPAELRDLEPYVAGISALYTPGTAVLDFGLVARAYAHDIRRLGGEIILGAEVVAISKAATGLVVQTARGGLEARTIVACAGLQSDRVARMAGAPDNVRIVPFRGDYYVLTPERRHLANRRLVYPVPDPALPFLGVHFTRRLDGQVWAGPNAVLAFAREGYRRSDVSIRDNLELLAFPGFWRMAWTWRKVGVSEMIRDFSRAAFLRSLQRYIPALQSSDLLPGPSGVRAQAVSREGKLLDDFALYTVENQVHVLNAPSPAATSSLAIARLIAGRAAEAFTRAPFRA